MKRYFGLRLLACLCALLLLLAGTGCGTGSGTVPDETTGASTPNPPSTVTVYFCDGNTVLSSVPVQAGSCVRIPTDIEKENHILSGWYLDQDLSIPFDFATPLYGDLYLYGKFTVDGVAITNKITTDTIHAIVKVEVSYVKYVLGFIPVTENGGHGSGVIFHKDDSTFYLLTNCHVAVTKEGYQKATYKIIDYEGNEYTGTLYPDAISAEYDLACLYFTSSSERLKPIEFAQNDPSPDDDVIALGTPKGQSNAIAFGTVVEYRTTFLQDTPAYESNVTFPVMRHTAYTGGGSSGGAIMNSELKLVGIHYAGNSGDTFERGYAIPISKVNEFLDAYVYKKNGSSGGAAGGVNP